MLDELADGVVGAVDLVMFGGEGVEEEGGDGGGGDVLGGEAEDVSDLSARIELGRLGKLEGRGATEAYTQVKAGADGSFEEQETQGSRCIPGYSGQHVEED